MTKLERNNVGRAAGVVSFYTLLSRILGLIRDMVMASFLGTGMAADAFVVAFRIPNLLRRLFAEGSLTNAFIPIFTEFLSIKTKEEAFDLARTVLTILACVVTLVTVIGVIFSPWIVRIMAPGFGGAGEKYDLTVSLTRIIFPYIFIISIVAFFMGILNSLKRFAAPAAAPIFLNLGMIGSVFFISSKYIEPTLSLAIGVLIGGLLQIGIQLPWVLKEGLALYPKWNLRHPALKKLGLLWLPTLFSSAVFQLNLFIGTLLASMLPEGSVSALYFADRLVQFPLGVFAIAVSTAVLPSLSSQAVQNETEKIQETLGYSLRIVFFIILPSMAGLLVLGDPITRIFFERFEYDAQSTIMTVQALFFYTLGLWAFSAIRVLPNVFFAFQDTRTPVKVAFVSIIINIILSLLLMGPLKHGGLALALSISSTFQMILLLYFIRRRIGAVFLLNVISSAFRSFLAALMMGLIVYFIHSNWLTVARESKMSIQIIELSCLIVIGIVSFVASARLVGCTEYKAVRKMAFPR